MSATIVELIDRIAAVEKRLDDRPNNAYLAKQLGRYQLELQIRVCDVNTMTRLGRSKRGSRNGR